MSEGNLTSKQAFVFHDKPEAIRGIGQRNRTSAVVCVIEMHNSLVSAAAEIERLQKRIRELEGAADEPKAPPTWSEEDREEYARVRSLSDEDIVSECMESHHRVVRELANRYDVVVERLEREPEPPSETERLRALIRRVVEWEPAFPVEASLLDELHEAAGLPPTKEGIR